MDNIDIVFHIGDIVYANGYISQWDQFTSQVEPIASRVPYMIARFVSPWDEFLNYEVERNELGVCPDEDIQWEFYFVWNSGNHERDWHGTGSFYDTDDSGGECGVLAETMFFVPAENRAKFW